MHARFTASKCSTSLRWIAGLYFCLFLSLCSLSAYSQSVGQGNEYEISSWFTSSGSIESSGGEYTLNGSMGMPIVGQMTDEDRTELYSSYLKPLSTAEDSFAGCELITEIPQLECDALVTLYNSTDGPNWDHQGGWLTTDTPCNWYGVACADGRVTELILSRHDGDYNFDNPGYNYFGLTGNLPPEIGDLTSLTVLTLLDNRLTSIPREIGNLENLEFFHLRNNLLTSLPDELWELPNIKSLYLTANELSTIPPEIGNLTTLRVLEIDYNPLSQLPAEIGNLTNLVKLDLDKTPLEILPAEIWNLSNLTTLTMWNAQLSEIPPEIGNLTKLVKLNVAINRLETLPPEIWTLVNLTELDLDTNQLRAISPEIGNLVKLKILDLDANKLLTLPDEIGDLTNLTDLYLSSNQLSTLPAEMSNLINLTDLRILYNRITTTDPALSTFLNEQNPTWRDTQTVALTELVASPLSENSIQLDWKPITFTQKGGYYEIEVAEDGAFTTHGQAINKKSNRYIVSNLKPNTPYSFRARTYTPEHDGSAIKNLGDAQNNELLSTYSSIASATTYSCADVDEIPDSECQALVALYANTSGPNWFNNDQWLEPEISPCIWYGVTCEEGHVVQLDLTENNLSGSIPPQIEDLPNLVTLDLGFNQIRVLPDEIGNLSLLTRLDLTSNNIWALPDTISNLTNLEELDLDANYLHSLPDTLADVPNLKILDLSDNLLKGLPENIGTLSELTTLDISLNELTQLPPSIGDLKNLTVLNVTDNRIEILPPEIGALSNLEILDLSYNYLISVPKEIGGLTNLAFLDLNHNRLSAVPDEIGNLKNLVSLSLRKNELIELPDAIVTLTNLTNLNVSYNRLIILPNEIGNLTDLTVLNLRSNELRVLPPSIGDLIGLDILDIRTNLLAVLPPEASRLTSTYIYYPLGFAPPPTATPTPPPSVPPGRPTPTPEPASWTLMVYANADNNLDKFIPLSPNDGGEGRAGNASTVMDRIKNLEGTTATGVQMVILVDGAASSDSECYILDADGNWTRENWTEENECSDGAPSEAMMTSQGTLQNFLRYGMNKFPNSKHYALSILGHANGTLGIGPEGDPTGTTWEELQSVQLTPEEIQSAISGAFDETNKELSILHFDGCSFGLFENVVIAEGLADYVIASPNTAWAVFPYDEYRVAASQNAMPNDYAQRIVGKYVEKVDKNRPYTISIFDMVKRNDQSAKHYTNLKYEISELGSNLHDYVYEEPKSTVLTSIRGEVQTYDSGDYNLTREDKFVDLGHLSAKLLGIDKISIRDDSQTISNTLANFVTFGHNNFDGSFTYGSDNQIAHANLTNAQGIGIFYPFSLETGTIDLEKYIENKIFPYLTRRSIKSDGEIWIWYWKKFLSIQIQKKRHYVYLPAIRNYTHRAMIGVIQPSLVPNSQLHLKPAPCNHLQDIQNSSGKFDFMFNRPVIIC